MRKEAGWEALAQLVGVSDFLFGIFGKATVAAAQSHVFLLANYTS